MVGRRPTHLPYNPSKTEEVVTIISRIQTSRRASSSCLSWTCYGEGCVDRLSRPQGTLKRCYQPTDSN